jgi:hypothetical protein
VQGGVSASLESDVLTTLSPGEVVTALEMGFAENGVHRIKTEHGWLSFVDVRQLLPCPLIAPPSCSCSCRSDLTMAHQRHLSWRTHLPRSRVDECLDGQICAVPPPIILISCAPR